MVKGPRKASGAPSDCQADRKDTPDSAEAVDAIPGHGVILNRPTGVRLGCQRRLWPASAFHGTGFLRRWQRLYASEIGRSISRSERARLGDGSLLCDSLSQRDDVV